MYQKHEIVKRKNELKVSPPQPFKSLIGGIYELNNSIHLHVVNIIIHRPQTQ
jgi:hypothetical protein